MAVTHNNLQLLFYEKPHYYVWELNFFNILPQHMRIIIESERLFRSKLKDYFTNLPLYSFNEYFTEVIYKTLFYTNELIISLLITIK